MAYATSTTERELLEAACRGDEDAFRRLVDPHRARLHAHCYSMLGSPHDAEDALQDALLRAWRALCGFERRSSLASWLYRIATNACLDALARRPKRVLPIDYGPAVDATGLDSDSPVAGPLWVEPYPDEALGLEEGYAGPAARYEQREAVELAFVAALQHLPPRQRAVLLLREVLGFSAKEVSQALGTTVAAVNSALQRARKALNERLPERSQQSTIRSLGDARARELVESFAEAFERGDVDAIVSLLAEDVTFSMPPHNEWYRGREAVADSWLMPGKDPPGLRYLATSANGQLALGVYALDPLRNRFAAIALDILTLRDAEIVEVTAFRMPEIFPTFGLPEELAA